MVRRREIEIEAKEIGEQSADSTKLLPSTPVKRLIKLPTTRNETFIFQQSRPRYMALIDEVIARKK